jgi:hypothetical protein
MRKNRVIINWLANRDTEVLLSRYSALITLQDVSKEVRQAIEGVVNAKPAELPARVDKLRSLYRNMLKLERTASE